MLALVIGNAVVASPHVEIETSHRKAIEETHLGASHRTNKRLEVPSRDTRRIEGSQPALPPAVFARVELVHVGVVETARPAIHKAAVSARIAVARGPPHGSLVLT